VVAYDGAPMSEAQLHTACRSANDINGIVRVLHVVELPWQIPLSAALSPEDQARVTELFDRARRIAARYGVPYEPVLATSHSVGEAIVAEAEEGQARAIFVGLRDRRRPGTSLFLSRTLRHVLQRAPCPVQIGYLPAGLPDSMAFADEVAADSPTS
jgi:nucleotide-binding universal stress UspA family protein